jgi:hypothetical protein
MAGTVAAVAAVVSAGTAVYTATRPVPKPPLPPQMKKTAGIGAIRQQNTPNNIAAMAAMSKAGSGTLLDSGGSAGGSTLTG